MKPEQYSNTFNDDQIKTLHDSIMTVCTTACELLADSEQFPETWLMKYRWDKGKKTGGKLPNGAKITFLTVGGRTSAVVPSVQKKTAAVAGDVSEGASDESEEGEAEVKPKKSVKRKTQAENTGDAEKAGDTTAATRPRRGRKQVDYEVKDESEEGEEKAPAPKKQKTATTSRKAAPKKTAGKSTEPSKGFSDEVEVKSEQADGRRRSGRTTK